MPEAGCLGTFKDGRFSLSGHQIFTSDAGFSCDGGNVIGYERLKTAIRFYYGSKRVTLGPKKSGTLGGYRIRVGLANSKQATFTIERATST